MGMSFQGGALFGSVTVGDNVALPLREHTPLDDSIIEIMVRLKLDQIIAAGIDELILKLKKAFRMTIVVVTHELASAYLIADRMILLDKGVIVANGTTAELQKSLQPRVRQFLDRVPEPEISTELDYLQMLTGEVPPLRQ